jgi:hypothetical protein
VAYPVDQSGRGSGGRIFAVFLAVLFLAVLGSSVGYLAGRQVQAHRDAQQTSGDQNGGDQTGGDQTGGDTPGPTGTTPSRLPGTHCPDQSEQDAKTQLVQVFYLKTSRSQVWICRDSSHKLWYQGLVGSSQQFTNDNSILLPDVEDDGDGTYTAMNGSDGTKYIVSKKSLVIQQPGGSPATEPAVSTGSG